MSRHHSADTMDWLSGDIGELRRAYELTRRVEDEETATWRTIDAGGRALGVLVQEPRTLRLPHHAIVYFHGGGWLVGSPRTHAGLSRALCEAAGMRLVSVDYRLAPEHPAPAPVEDGLAALAGVLAPDPAWGDVAGAVLCGDSAGGGIALAVERAAHAAHGARIRGVCSFYGCHGLFGTESMAEFASRADGLDEACIRRMWDHANGGPARSPYSTESLAAPRGAPVRLLAAGRDPLRDDTLALAAAYERLGRSHALDVVAEAGHGFLSVAPDHPTAVGAIARAADWIGSCCSDAG